MRALCLLVLATVALCGPALAREPGADDLARLSQGRVVVEVHVEPNHGEGVFAAADIAATPDQVWAVMTDCGEALHYVPRLKSCRVLESDPAGHWDVRRHQLAGIPLLPDVRATFRLDYDRPREMRFRQIAGDMSGSQGAWRLAPLDGGRRTRVIYEARLSLPHGVPRPLLHALIRHDAPAALEGLRARAVGAAQRR